jgi:hypothetical protein
MDPNILAKWNEIKSMVGEIEIDVLKNSKGNAAAGVRVRKGLRHIKSLSGELVKLSLDLVKSKTDE